jgi:hypothetical protein
LGIFHVKHYFVDLRFLESFTEFDLAQLIQNMIESIPESIEEIDAFRDIIDF